MPPKRKAEKATAEPATQKQKTVAKVTKPRAKKAESATAAEPSRSTRVTRAAGFSPGGEHMGLPTPARSRRQRNTQVSTSASEPEASVTPEPETDASRDYEMSAEPELTMNDFTFTPRSQVSGMDMSQSFTTPGRAQDNTLNLFSNTPQQQSMNGYVNSTPQQNAPGCAADASQQPSNGSVANTTQQPSSARLINSPQQFANGHDVNAQESTPGRNTNASQHTTARTDPRTRAHGVLELVDTKPVPSREMKFKKAHSGIIALGREVYGRPPDDIVDEEYSDDGLGFSDGPEYTARALANYKNPPGFRRSNIPFDIPPQSTDSPKTLRRLAAKAANRSPKKAGPNATRSLVRWAERDESRIVPNAGQMVALLDNFNAQQKVKVTTTDEEPQLEEAEVQTLQPPATPQRQTSATMDMPTVIDNEEPAVADSPNYVQQPETPVPVTPQQQDAARGFWGISAVKSIMATPFNFFRHREQSPVATTNNVPVIPTPQPQPSHTVAQTPQPQTSKDTNIFTRTNKLFRDDTESSQPTKTASSAVKAASEIQFPTLVDVLQKPPTPSAAGYRKLPPTQHKQFRPTPKMAMPRSERLRLEAERLRREALQTPLHLRGVVSEERKREVEQDREERRKELNAERLSQRELNELAEDSDYASNTMRTARLGEKRKTTHREPEPEVESHRRGARVRGREMSERQLDEEDYPPCSINGARAGEKRKKPHKEPKQVAPNTFSLDYSDFSDSSDDDMQDDDNTAGPSRGDTSPTLNRRIAKPARSVRFADELEPEPATPYTGSIARQPPWVQQNINRGESPLGSGIPDCPKEFWTAPGTKWALPLKRPEQETGSGYNLFATGSGINPIISEKRQDVSSAASSSKNGVGPSANSSTAGPSTIGAGLSATLNDADPSTNGAGLFGGTSAARPSLNGSSSSVLQERENTQAPPPPRPANAVLPAQNTPTQNTPHPAFVAKVEIAKAKVDAHKPKVPSGLREVANMSPMSDANKENMAMADEGIEFDPEVLEAVNACFPRKHYIGFPEGMFDPEVEAEVLRLLPPLRDNTEV